jgi:hypothetical protein
MAVGAPEIEQFQDFLRERIQEGAADLTPEKAVQEFRAYQDELERCRREIQPALESSLRGESQPLDIEDVIARGRQRFAEKDAADGQG